jgi:hypothetical protein
VGLDTRSWRSRPVRDRLSRHCILAEIICAI